EPGASRHGHHRGVGGEDRAGGDRPRSAKDGGFRRRGRGSHRRAVPLLARGAGTPGHRVGQRLPTQAVRTPVPSECGTYREGRPPDAGDLMAKEFRLPDIGEGLTEAEIVRWVVPVGGTVGVDETVVEVETDKAVVEIPSPFAGVVLHHGAAE